jgi:hypothetical protein
VFGGFALLLAACPSGSGPGSSHDVPDVHSPTVSPPRASNPSRVRDPGPDFESFGMPGVQGLIVGEAEAGRFYDALAASTSPTYWRPEKAQLIDLETRLPAFLKTKAPAGSRLRKEPKAFRRQYLGIENAGQRVVFVNLFCETNRRDWTRKPITADGAADCYFQLHYDPARRAFSDLRMK